MPRRGGLFILLIVIYALSSGITDLLSGGRHVDFKSSYFLCYIFTVADTAYYLYVRRINKSLQSNLIKFDNVSWYVDALLEAAILISFVCSYYARKLLNMLRWATYIDPIVLNYFSGYR